MLLEISAATGRWPPGTCRTIPRIGGAQFPRVVLAGSDTMANRAYIGRRRAEPFSSRRLYVDHVV